FLMHAQYSSHALPTRLGQSGSNEASRQRPIWAYALRWKPLPSFLNERERQIVGIATLIHSTKIQSDSATFERRRRFEARKPQETVITVCVCSVEYQPTRPRERSRGTRYDVHSFRDCHSECVRRFAAHGSNRKRARWPSISAKSLS